MQTRHFPIIVEIDEDGVFIVSCPSFHGCHSFGNTLEDAMANIREVIELCLEEEGEQQSVSNTFIGVRDIEVVVHA